LRWGLPFQGHVGLDKVVVDALAFRERGLHGFPSPLDLHPLSDRAVQPLNAVVVGVGLAERPVTGPCEDSKMATEAIATTMNINSARIILGWFA
jgi:hypothetical protein